MIDFEDNLIKNNLYQVTRKELNTEILRYNIAVNMYKNASFEEALVIFNELENNEYKTNKNIYKIYIERCKFHISNPPKDFNGVFVHTTKG